MDKFVASKNKRLALFDGNAILHRAYHAYPTTLTTQAGELTNAVYGFTSTLLTAFKRLQPSHVVVAFDEKGPTFRHQQYEEYKASRPKMDEDLANQIG
ncbi:MAG: PIN domain-containing protein, partial [Patescibacteria group bacterium]